MGWLVGGLHDVPRFPGERILKRPILNLVLEEERTDPLGAELGGVTDVTTAAGVVSTLPRWSHLRDQAHVSQSLPNLFVTVQPLPVKQMRAGRIRGLRFDYPDMQHLKTPPFSRHSLANLLYSAFRQFSQHFVSSALPSIPGTKETKSKP